MQLKEAIENRRSIRGFLPKPVPQEILRQVLALGSRAISANNIQPWEFWVAAGEPLDRLRRANVEDLYSGAPEAEHMGVPGYGIYRERGKAIGKQLFAAMGIARDDREKRAWWSERGFRFFDAPAAIFLCLDRDLDLAKFAFDIGCAAQNICLAAMEFGLGTCVEDQAVMYQRGLRQILKIPPDRRPVTGIAIGYPDGSFPANGVVSQRDPVDSVTTWVGF